MYSELHICQLKRSPHSAHVTHVCLFYTVRCLCNLQEEVDKTVRVRLDYLASDWINRQAERGHAIGKIMEELSHVTESLNQTVSQSSLENLLPSAQSKSSRELHELMKVQEPGWTIIGPLVPSHEARYQRAASS